MVVAVPLLASAEEVVEVGAVVDGHKSLCPLLPLPSAGEDEAVVEGCMSLRRNKLPLPIVQKGHMSRWPLLQLPPAVER